MATMSAQRPAKKKSSNPSSISKHSSNQSSTSGTISEGPAQTPIETKITASPASKSSENTAQKGTISEEPAQTPSETKTATSPASKSSKNTAQKGKISEGPAQTPSETKTAGSPASKSSENTAQKGKISEGPAQTPSETKTATSPASKSSENTAQKGKISEGPAQTPSETKTGGSPASKSSENTAQKGKISEGPAQTPSETKTATSPASKSSENTAQKGTILEGPAKTPSETKTAGSPASKSPENTAQKALNMAPSTSRQAWEEMLTSTVSEEAAASSYDEELAQFLAEHQASLDDEGLAKFLADRQASSYNEGFAQFLAERQASSFGEGLEHLLAERLASSSEEGLEQRLEERRLSTATTLTLQDDEIFEDAKETQVKSMGLQASFDDCNEAIQKFFNNDIPGAMAIMIPWAHNSLYHSLGLAIFLFIPAMLTFDKGQLLKASKAIKNCIELCNKHRRVLSFAQSLGSVVKKHKYADFTDLEAHAELCHAEALLLQAALTVADGDDYSSYVRGILKIKSCYSSYKVCWQIKEHKQWLTEQSKDHFESGVRLGTATFNLMVSLLPPRIISLLEFVGFSGSRIYGITELERGGRSPGMRAVLCDLTLLVYYLIVIPFIGGQGNIDAAELIFQTILVTYPNSVWLVALRARSEFLKGRLQHSINAYKRALIGQENFRQFRILCYWELMWVHGLNLDCLESATYAELLINESAWSKTTHLYIKAAMLMQLDPSDVTDSHREIIDNAMRLAPLAKSRIAGKTLPIEKFILKRCERYNLQGKRLILPAFELLNFWNMFHQIRENKDHLAIILRIIEQTRRTLIKEANDWMGAYVNDNFALVYYLYGCTLCAMQLPRQALLELQKVIDLKKSLKEDTFLIPYAVCEMAMCQYQMGDMQAAMELLHDVKKKYSGYAMETRLHFRVTARVEVVRSVIGASKFTPGVPGIKINKHFDE